MVFQDSLSKKRLNFLHYRSVFWNDVYIYFTPAEKLEGFT